MKAESDHSTCPRCDEPRDGDICFHCAGQDLERSSAFAKKLPSLEFPTLEDWSIERLISVGGMSEVWLGIREDSEQAAIKVLPNSKSQDGELVRRFEREAEILSSLEHENIAALLDVGSCEDGRLYLATEYVDGSDLARLTKAEKLSTERALDIFSRVADAVIYAHGEGIVHRDLKPGNILVAREGTIKLTDFGLARDVESKTGEFQTQREGGLGTAYYVAPEALYQAGSADPRADVYSLGVLLYELMMGKPPLGTYSLISTETPLSKNWDALIRRALQENPEDRFQSGEEFGGEVTRLWSRHQAKLRGGHRARWGLGLCSLVIAGLLGAWMATRTDETTTPDPVYPSPTTATRKKPWINSLEMRFLPLPGFMETHLMAETETSLAAFLAFHENEQSLLPIWREREEQQAKKIAVLTPVGWEFKTDNPGEQPGYEANGNSPAFGVPAIKARYFCRWLTIRERALGRIGEDDVYRLPTVEEWNAAASESDLATANFARQEIVLEQWPLSPKLAEGDDGFPFFAHVNEGAPNPHGFFHCYGNVFEWVLLEADEDGRQKAGVIGGSWASNPKKAEVATATHHLKYAGRRTDNGFRCLLVLGEE